MDRDKSRIHGWLADREDGCAYYRMWMPLNQLAQHGHSVSVNQTLDMSRFNGIVIGQRVCKVGSSILWQKMADGGKHFLVYEVDDDLFNVDPSNEIPYYQFTHPEITENLHNNIRLADLVTVSTEPLADVMRKYNPNVVVLPNYIEDNMLTLPKPVIQFNEAPGKPADMSQYVTIGYASSPTHAMDFATVADHLRLLGHRDKRVVYVWFGESYALDVRQIHVPWTNAGVDYFRQLNFDIGIAPLAPHTFNDSKSYIKALEYASQGIPVVASDQPPYRDFVQHGKTGFLAKTPYDFYKYLRELVSSEKLRKEMGYNARQQAKQYTIQEHWPKWAQAYGIQPVKQTTNVQTVEVPA